MWSSGSSGHIRLQIRLPLLCDFDHRYFLTTEPVKNKIGSICSGRGHGPCARWGMPGGMVHLEHRVYGLRGCLDLTPWAQRKVVSCSGRDMRARRRPTM